MKQDIQVTNDNTSQAGIAHHKPSTPNIAGSKNKNPNSKTRVIK